MIQLRLIEIVGKEKGNKNLETLFLVFGFFF